MILTILSIAFLVSIFAEMYFAIKSYRAQDRGLVAEYDSKVFIFMAANLLILGAIFIARGMGL